LCAFAAARIIEHMQTQLPAEVTINTNQLLQAAVRRLTSGLTRDDFDVSLISPATTRPIRPGTDPVPDWEAVVHAEGRTWLVMRDGREISETDPGFPRGREYMRRGGLATL
jgi:hypothetical protein